MHTTITSRISRARRHARIRARISGTQERPRLSVFSSLRFISVQVIDDTTGCTIVCAHGREFGGSKLSQAKSIGEAIAVRAKKEGITTIVFDRGGYTYATRIKALADAARKGGLVF
ncbi:MAG TPA: 50S ribosomal protein L18 [Candidatus Kaiserbacteria bacterium]|nr:50S ribosomal protein L18 [Candidatus Kaiserbacteria bacterium]